MEEIINGIPNIAFSDADIKNLTSHTEPCYAPISNINFDKVKSGFGIALHQHQPTIPAGGDDLSSASLVSNLQHMWWNQGFGDNHNAPVFMWCYTRIADFTKELVSQGKNPRVMLDYSGNLLWGLRQMEGGSTLENLKSVTCDPKYYQNVEWLGTMWSHAVATSTPIPDLKLHIMAFRKHFASIFGEEAVRRVKGFSPPEMHLPIHPDVCYEYVKALKECGYQWLMVQEHTIENIDGSHLEYPHLPHQLIAKNSQGEVVEITVIIKTQGSDTKLVAQMQPYYEAQSIDHQKIGKKSIPPFVTQIGDGENGGVMMNEFPPMFNKVMAEVGTEGVVAMNGSEYLEFLAQKGITEKDFVKVQPIAQHRIWKQIKKPAKGAADKAIAEIHAEDQGFNMDKASWTSDRSWVAGYEDVLGPMEKLSIEFHKKYDGKKVDVNDEGYRNALLYLLLSETSCFRYWGEGIWTDYAKELSRRGLDACR